MKISCTTGGFKAYTLKETFLFFEEIGIPFVEISTDDRKHAYPFIFQKQPQSELVDLLNNFSPKIKILSGGWSDFGLKDDLMTVQMENVMKQFEFCQKFGIKIIRLFASHIPAKYVDDSFFDRVINNLIIVSDMAKEMDIMVALENHGGITGTSDDCLRILRGVNRENIGLNYDAANFVPCNQDPVDAVRILKDYIFHVHLKDVVFTNNGKLEGWEFCTFGDGKINYIEIRGCNFYHRIFYQSFV